MQPKLFENTTETVSIEDVILYALGDFQTRGKVLAERELALDRLRGAFLRAFAKYGVGERLDEEIVAGLRKLGARVSEVPSFVAKHPYHVMVFTALAEKSFEAYKRQIVIINN